VKRRQTLLTLRSFDQVIKNLTNFFVPGSVPLSFHSFPITPLSIPAPSTDPKSISDSLDTLSHPSIHLTCATPTIRIIPHQTIDLPAKKLFTVSPPQKSVDSGTVCSSSASEEEDEVLIQKAVAEDQSIMWLQQRIEAMNQTLEAYACPGELLGIVLSPAEKFGFFESKLLTADSFT
jgi:hypothetical protein